MMEEKQTYAVLLWVVRNQWHGKATQWDESVVACGS
ncbi:hypothetical protein SLEP1_g24573 [Rubroshorea leprosula]|uniref:Uncharacterized protein n=1 Tax=Rubroshorea leprosula TaxID=152421 RepID=A0AAV5JQI9_9ROSI|nr:hypothetical protein SLEP1_g24573 [Rubroshorea leprosula]